LLRRGRIKFVYDASIDEGLSDELGSISTSPAF
jgi:hypothetical protein